MIVSLPTARTFRTLLSTGLAFVIIAMASIASLNAAQHAARNNHHHSGFGVAISEVVQDDQHDVAVAADDGNTETSKVAKGHSHGDAPSSFAILDAAQVQPFARSGLPVSAGNDPAVLGDDPGGLSRPPRTLDIAV